MIDLSIIIVSYNTKKLTLECIKSIQEEGSVVRKEIIVVDNDSKDGSLEALRELQKKKAIKLVENKENLGFAKANNQGIKIAEGEYILLLNSDTIVKKKSLGKMFKFAQSTEDGGVIAARLLNADGSLQPSCLHFPTIRSAILEYWFGRKGLFEKYTPKDAKPTAVDAAVAACFLITPKALKKVGLLDERYHFYFEDIDYCRRVRSASLKVYYLPTAEVYHYHGASGKHLADEKDQWRRLIPSSKIYHGLPRHYLLTAILWLGQKWQKATAKK